MTSLFSVPGIDSLLEQGYSVATDTSLGLAEDKKWLGKFVQMCSQANNGLVICCTESQAHASRAVSMEILHAQNAGRDVYICYPGGQIQPVHEQF
eukprot:SAG31_NODE_3616_length_4066_cov_1.641543_3_plen_95_part_00